MKKISPEILWGSAVLLILVLTAVLAPWITKYQPNDANPIQTFIAPCAEHPMGTDNIGRDIWTRFCYGGRVSLAVGVIAMLIGVILGTLLGIIAGYFGGVVDSVLSWMTEVLMAFPGMLLALSIMAILGPGLSNVMVAVGLGSIPQYMRMARGQVLQIREMVYVDAARCIGCTSRRLLFRHILPNILRPLISLAALGIGNAILESAALSFLGLGAQPMTPEWGSMLSSGRQYLRNAPWVCICPGIGIFLVILSINLIGEGLGKEMEH